jgi:hypothetical protein
MFFANYQFPKVDKIVYLQTATTNKSIKNIKKDNNKRQGEPLQKKVYTKTNQSILHSAVEIRFLIMERIQKTKQLVLKVHSKKEPMVCINNWEK